MNTRIRTTHTLAMLDLSRDAYDEIADKLRAAGYDHAFDGEMIDMTGIGVLPPARVEPTEGSYVPSPEEVQFAVDAAIKTPVMMRIASGEVTLKGPVSFAARALLPNDNTPAGDAGCDFAVKKFETGCK